MHLKTLCLGHCSQAAITSQQGPGAALRQRESKGVGQRQALVCAAQDRRLGDFERGQLLDDQAHARYSIKHVVTLKIDMFDALRASALR